MNDATEHALTSTTIRMIGRSPTVPVTLINLIKFRQYADYGHGFALQGISGRAAYESYMSVARAVLADIGALPLIDTPGHLLAAEHCDGDWDRIIIVRYPTGTALLGLGQIPRYVAALAHRSAAIERNMTFCGFNDAGWDLAIRA